MSDEEIDPAWQLPDDLKPKYPCQCCDFVTLLDRGDELLCPVCYWEDDGRDVDALDAPSAPNYGVTLRQARANFKAFGAFDKSAVEHVCSVDERTAFRHAPREIG